MSTASRNSLIAAGCGIFSAWLSTRGWGTGIPAFSHDWKWPLDAVQLHQMPQMLSSLFSTWGSGGPEIQALGSYPILIPQWLLGLVLPPWLVLYAIVCAIGALGAYAIARAARATGLAVPLQLIGALAYPLMPPWFNRLCAGHLAWLLGYALFPLALALVLEVTDARKRAASLALWLGAAAAQIQFLIFFPLALLGAVRRRQLASVAIAFGLACAMQLPALAAIVSAQLTGAFVTQHPNLMWQSAQSAPMRFALVGGADPAHYFETIVGAFAPWIFIPAITLGVCATVFVPRVRALGVVWLIASAWSAGLDGPLARLFAWIFTNVPQAVAFREFAHAQAVVAPLLVLLVLHGAAFLGRRTAVASTLAAIALIPLCAAAASGAVTHIVPPVAFDANRHAAVLAIRRLPGDGQVLWWPGLQPLSYKGSRGGVDSEAFRTGEHDPYVEYRPTAALAHADDALAGGDPAGCGLLADMGIQAVIIRDGIHLELPGFPRNPPDGSSLLRAGLRPVFRSGGYMLYAVPCYAGRFTSAKPARLYGDWSDIEAAARKAGATDELTAPPQLPARCSVALARLASYRTLDLDKDWVPLSALDARFRDFDNAFDDVDVTASPQRIPSLGSFLSAASGEPYRWRDATGLRELAQHGPVAIWNTSRDCQARNALRVGAFSAAKPFDAEDASSLGPRLVVAHYGPSAGWTLLLDGEHAGRPALADGFAVGWLVPPSGSPLQIVHAGPSPAILWGLSLLAVGGCAILLFL